MRSMAWLKGLPTSLIWPARSARADGDRAAQPMAQPRPSIAPELRCRGRSVALWGRCCRPLPASCPLAGDQGCYAEAGFHTRLHWDRLSRGESGSPAAAFIRQVMALQADILFRHSV